MDPNTTKSVDTDEKTEADGVGLIAAERRRQVDELKKTAANDAALSRGELNFAAQSYLWAATIASLNEDSPQNFAAQTKTPLSGWPWIGPETWHPVPDQIRNLVKAGALVAAEIDRLLAIKCQDPDKVNSSSGELIQEPPPDIPSFAELSE